VELADTSVWTSKHLDAEVDRTFLAALNALTVATCDMVKLELLFSTRDRTQFTELRHELDALPGCPIGPREWTRALDVCHELAARGPLHHRQVPAADLLVAAAAESAGIPVLHYDRHFEVIAEVTGQPVRALAPLGSL
jgi:predicted nucleic acid-binding protein